MFDFQGNFPAWFRVRDEPKLLLCVQLSASYRQEPNKKTDTLSFLRIQVEFRSQQKLVAARRFGNLE
jgi:hypothetical protein